MRLQQHLCKTGCSGSIAVDREDILRSASNATARVRQKIVLGRFADEAHQVMVCRLSIPESGIVVHEIGAAPLCILPVRLVDTPLQCDARSPGERRGLFWGDLILRIEGDQV